MKDKEKQIEEIQGLLFCNKWEQPFADCEENVKCIECIAKQIYNAGYRKIDKDSVVLSKGAHESLSSKAKANVVNAIEIRKSTAEKIYNFVRHSGRSQIVYENRKEKSFSLVNREELNNFVKQFGVEIKE